MKHKTKLFEIANNIELLIGWDEAVLKQVPQVIEFHGIHTIEEDELLIKLTSVEFVIKGKGYDILPLISEQSKESIIDNLAD